MVTGRVLGRGDAVKSEPEVIALLEQFRRAVQNSNERRKSPRFRTDLAICVYRIDDEIEVHAPIVGVCRDVSASGLSCVLPSPILTGHAFVTFPAVPEFAPWAIIATIVRSRALADGSVAVAGRFVHVGT